MTRMRTLMVALALLAGLAAPLAGQAVIEMPEDLMPFWSRYLPAHEADDEPAMDKAVRAHPDLAEQALDLIIDDFSRADLPELHDDGRALARSLDRATGQSRFIERVRFVLGLSPTERFSRYAAMKELNKAFTIWTEAAEERSSEGWQRSVDAFQRSADAMEALGDVEFSIIALRKLADLELVRNNPWERSQHLKHIVKLGESLAYKEIEVESAQAVLAELKLKGIDPDLPKPDALPTDAAAPAASEADGAGRGLTSFKAGSTEQSFTLKLDVPKKGLGSMSLPGPFPLDNYLLWPVAWIEGAGGKALNYLGPAPFQPFGTPMTLGRDGAEFHIESTGDGKPDATFTPNTTPQLIEIPAPDGKGSYPLMVSIPGERENMFGIDVNLSPQPGSAQMRLNIASSMNGEVLGETWKVMDCNLSGVFGDAADWWGDLVTTGNDAKPVNFQLPDAVLIGKAKAPVAWSSVLPVGDGFHRATLTPDGRTLTLQQLDLATGFVKLDINTPVQPTHVILREVGKLEGCYLNVVPARKGGSVTVPAGTWQLAFGRLEKGAKTSMQQVRIHRGQMQPFEVKPGETATLSLGGPYRIEAITKLDGKDTVVEGLTMRVYGRSNEEYAMFFDDTLKPNVEVRTADGKKVGKPLEMRRPDNAAWETSPVADRILWFPHELRIEHGKAEKLQVRLTQKSQLLIGGPFDSDWIP